MITTTPRTNHYTCAVSVALCHSHQGALVGNLGHPTKCSKLARFDTINLCVVPEPQATVVHDCSMFYMAPEMEGGGGLCITWFRGMSSSISIPSVHFTTLHGQHTRLHRQNTTVHGQSTALHYMDKNIYTTFFLGLSRICHDWKAL